MTAFRVDDSIYDHPKFVGLSDSALALWLRCAAYCSRHLTDGHIPTAIVNRFASGPEAIKELMKAGLWKMEGGGFWFHDWHDWNPSRAEVEERRRRDAERKRNERNPPARTGAKSRAKSPNGQHERKRGFSVRRADPVQAESPGPIQDSKESLTRVGPLDAAPPTPVDREHQAEMSRRTMEFVLGEMARRRGGE